MDTLEQSLNDSLKELNHPVFKDVVKIETKVQPMGDGQVVIISEIKGVILTLTKSNGEKVKVKTVAKVEADDSVPGKQMAIDSGAFDTETMMYNVVLKKMEDIMASAGDNKLIWPDCYYCKDHKFIFQDLRDVDYKIVPTHKFLDAEHTLLVMESIGKFHALSMVLVERKLIDIDNFRLPYFCQDNPGMEQFMQFGINHLLRAIKEHWEPEWSPIADRLGKYFSTGMKAIKETWAKTKGKWDVINHGDFSMRNMMFHYPADSTHPDAVKFVDFQMCHYSNLGFDLALILYTSLLPKIRDENMQNYLSTYTNSLRNTLTAYKYGGKMPTLQDVSDCMKDMEFLTTTFPIFNLPFFIESKNEEDIQKKADEYMKAYKDAEKSAGPGMINYCDKTIQEVVKSEILRCIDQGIF